MQHNQDRDRLIDVQPDAKAPDQRVELDRTAYCNFFKTIAKGAGVVTLYSALPVLLSVYLFKNGANAFVSLFGPAMVFLLEIFFSLSMGCGSVRDAIDQMNNIELRAR